MAEFDRMALGSATAENGGVVYALLALVEVTERIATVAEKVWEAIEREEANRAEEAKDGQG